MNGLGVRLASDGGYIYVARITRLTGRIMKPLISFGFDSFEGNPANKINIGLPLLQARGIIGYLAGDSDKVTGTTKPHLDAWYSAAGEIIKSGEWHANPTIFAAYNRSTPAALPERERLCGEPQHPLG